MTPDRTRGRDETAAERPTENHASRDTAPTSDSEEGTRRARRDPEASVELRTRGDAEGAAAEAPDGFSARERRGPEPRCARREMPAPEAREADCRGRACEGLAPGPRFAREQRHGMISFPTRCERAADARPERRGPRMRAYGASVYAGVARSRKDARRRTDRHGRCGGTRSGPTGRGRTMRPERNRMSKRKRATAHTASGGCESGRAVAGRWNGRPLRIGGGRSACGRWLPAPGRHPPLSQRVGGGVVGALLT